MLHSDVARTMVEAPQQQVLQEEKATRLSRQSKGHKPNWVQRINDTLTPSGSLVMAILYLGRPKQF